MGYIEDYLLYQSGNECHAMHHRWSALTLMSAIVGKRVFLEDGGDDSYAQLRYHPNIYTCLVGPQGARKTFAKDEAREIMLQTFPEYPVAASVETREAICQYLGSDESSRVYIDENGAAVEWHPFFLAINELKNFLSVNPAGMIDFIVDIYDRKFYDVKTKNKGTDRIVNPYVTILACATTEYIVDQLRDKILSGGLARRMVFINESKEVGRIASPRIPEGGKAAMERVVNHLKLIEATISGPIRWASPADHNYYKLWYTNLKFPSDPLMAGFYRSKHVQVLKLAMLYGLSQYPPTKLITREILSTAITTINEIEPGMTKLFMSAGRNELIVPQQALLDLLERCDGWLPQKQLMRDSSKNLSPSEYMSIERFLIDSGQVIRKEVDVKGVKRTMIMLPSKLTELETLNAEAQPTS